MFNRNNSLEIVILILFAFFAGFICTISAFAQEHGDDFVIGKYLQMNSKILNENRTIVVHLPEGYDKSHGRRARRINFRPPAKCPRGQRCYDSLARDLDA